MIECEGRGLNPHTDQSFPLSFCEPISITRTIAQIDIGKYGTAFYPLIDYSDYFIEFHPYTILLALPFLLKLNSLFFLFG